MAQKGFPFAYQLLQIKEKWNANLPSWMITTDYCKQWEGVTCNVQRQTIGLNLTNKGLTGRMPTEISSLKSLISLDLSSMGWSSADPWNHVTGDLYPLRTLKNLKILHVDNNNLTTKFPYVVLKLTNLTSLRLDNTNMIGPFPSGLSTLSNLQYLYLGNNKMSGVLPSDLGSLNHLVELNLWNNPMIKSQIPVEISNLVNLTDLNLQNSGLWGGLPKEFSNLVRLKRMNLAMNKLTGVIPDTWLSMKSLEELKLEMNFLTKGLPLWILKHPNLRVVDVSNNQLYGSSENATNNHLRLLNATCNFFQGTWPPISSELLFHHNCYSKMNMENDTSKSLCSPAYSCEEFFNQLKDDGCPRCPNIQDLVDLSMCICRQGNNEFPPKKPSPALKILEIYFSPAVVLILSAISLICIFRWHRNRLSKDKRIYAVRGLMEHWEAPHGIRRFNVKEISRATNNFHIDHQIGIGGFGKVFYGTLDSRKKVAVKCASETSAERSYEFHNEILLLHRLDHPNLVHLEGFCESEDLQVLVYEYVSNGNLGQWIFSDAEGICLHWFRRLEIALGVARGLLYLHCYANPPVIHRDIKPSNILLDDQFVPKLSDFGLCQTQTESWSHISTDPAGTAGYIDPQYFLSKRLTFCSDIYSFGIVLLELITGQKAIDTKNENRNILDWVKSCKHKGIEAIIDPKLGSDYPKHIYHNVAELALKCTAFDKGTRPATMVIAATLESCIKAASLPLPFSLSESDKSSLSDSQEEELSP